ncbi:cilium assembly, partial [Branchiostoma belcheri]
MSDESSEFTEDDIRRQWLPLLLETFGVGAARPVKGELTGTELRVVNLWTWTPLSPPSQPSFYDSQHGPILHIYMDQIEQQVTVRRTRQPGTFLLDMTETLVLQREQTTTKIILQQTDDLHRPDLLATHRPALQMTAGMKALPGAQEEGSEKDQWRSRVFDESLTTESEADDMSELGERLAGLPINEEDSYLSEDDVHSTDGKGHTRQVCGPTDQQGTRKANTHHTSRDHSSAPR